MAYAYRATLGQVRDNKSLGNLDILGISGNGFLATIASSPSHEDDGLSLGMKRTRKLPMKGYTFASQTYRACSKSNLELAHLAPYHGIVKTLVNQILIVLLSC